MLRGNWDNQWQTPWVIDFDDMLDAHVRFEMARWVPGRAGESAAAELHRILDWVEALPLSQLVTRDTLTRWLTRYLCQVPVTEDAYQAALAALLAGRAAAAGQDTRLGDLVGGDDFRRLAGTVIGMKDLQRAVIDEITTSEVYSQLISHVLYEGVKGYLTNENVISRRVPGAQSVMRLGQSAFGSAAPGLSRGIDRQLGAFVNANIADTMRDSREYLQQALDDELLLAVADNVYAAAADAPLSDAAGQLDPQALTDLAAVAADMWIRMRASDAFAEIARAMAHALYDRLGDQPVGDLMAVAGVTRDEAIDDALPLLTAAVAAARGDGTLESWIRGRLAPFYEEYAAGVNSGMSP